MRPERGQTSVFLVGLVAVLMLAVAVVVDASAAFLQRQRLDSVAEGAALVGADAAVQGEQVYTGGLDAERLLLTQQAAREAVAAYLTDTGLHADHPGLTAVVRVEDGGRTISVVVSAPLELPLSIPGGPGHVLIGARGAAVVTPRE